MKWTVADFFAHYALYPWKLEEMERFCAALRADGIRSILVPLWVVEEAAGELSEADSEFGHLIWALNQLNVIWFELE